MPLSPTLPKAASTGRAPKQNVWVNILFVQVLEGILSDTEAGGAEQGFAVTIKYEHDEWVVPRTVVGASSP